MKFDINGWLADCASNIIEADAVSDPDVETEVDFSDEEEIIIDLSAPDADESAAYYAGSTPQQSNITVIVQFVDENGNVSDWPSAEID